MNFPVPWLSGRRSIYEFIRRHVDPNTSTAPLPDDDAFWRDRKLRWVAGGFDGAFGHHGKPSRDEARAREILAALKSAIGTPDLTQLEDLFGRLISNDVLSVGDVLVEMIMEDRGLSSTDLAELARWLAKEAPDRGAVKFAILMLGAVGEPSDLDLVIALGRHEEFSLFTAKALLAMVRNPELILWDLAKGLHGWERIQVVERMGNARDPAVKRWLVRQGCQNNVMPEYTAGVCARAGNLTEELRTPAPAPDLLHGAGTIIRALLAGSPSKGMTAYAGGAEASVLYLKQIGNTIPADLSPFWVAHGPKGFVEEPLTGRIKLELNGWVEPLRNMIAEQSAAIMARLAWRDIAMSWLHGTDDSQFFAAYQVLEELGIDTWETRFERWEAGQSLYHDLLQTDEVKRIDRVLAVFDTRLDLDAIASGPRNELGLGPDFEDHRMLGFILQVLPRFPGHGANFVVAGLRSPVTGNRNAALRTLAAWGPELWPAATRASLEEALASEPNTEVLQRMRNLLRGVQLEAGILRVLATIQ